MSALDIWALAIWQADSYEHRGAFRTLYAVGVVTLMWWAKLATRCADPNALPKSLQTEETP